MAAPFLLALAIRRQPLLSVGLSRALMRPGLQLGAALALIAVFLSSKIYTIINGLTAAEGLYLVAMLIAGLTEEFIFRGYIQLRLMGWLGEIPGWLLAAALYALWHVPQKLILEGVSLPQLGLSLAYLFVWGLLLGWILRKSGSILATGIYHAVHNWIQVL
jgi:membrane protease YdiL (CAAX protease family)